MNETTVEISLPLIFPEAEDERDQCIGTLQEMLQAKKGILSSHLKTERNPANLCVHYDPNLVSLAAVRRMARESGSKVAAEHRHEQIPFAGLDSADAAQVVESELERLPGMIHARLSYAAGLAFVAYRPQQLGRSTIETAMSQLGAYPLISAQAGKAENEHEHEHGSAPTFLPHWMQDRWSLILVGLNALFLGVAWIGERSFGLPSTAAIAFYLLAYLAGGYEVAHHAFPSLLRGKFDTDVLMLAAAGGAAALGEWTEGAFLLLLFSLGHAGEHYALDRARSAINALGALMPKTARVRRGAQWVEEPVERLAVGDRVLVRPGDRIPVDGSVVGGTSAVDQSPITGESLPVQKGRGDDVFAGTINREAALEVTVQRLSKDTTLSRVLVMVAEAQSQQSPTQQFTERFSARFVPAVLVLVGLVIAIPPLFGWLTLSQSFYRGMLLLVAASPCALAIGTPAAVLAGIAQAARNGVLIKGGVHLENLGRVNVMAFDKTGTLTEGRFEVTDIVTLNGLREEELLALAGAVEQQSSHPLAQAVLRAAQARKLDFPQVERAETVPGLGVLAYVSGQEVQIGSRRLFEQAQGVSLEAGAEREVERLEGLGRSTMLVRGGGRFLGVLALADRPRAGVKAVLARLKAAGVQQLVMLTGDHPQVAEQVGAALGVDAVRAGLLPEDKLRAIQQMEQKQGLVAMVGDGVNDAPALASATVGIAMGGAGTAVALETADVALMGDDLSKLPFAVGLSRASRKIIQQNLVISLSMIALLVMTSVIGLVQLSWAVVLHEGSTVLVAFNALRLLAYQEK